ncbi:hypothetical protein A4H97_25555 [Niastella yeongjuensis]|uniref:Uncharacterized protein n=1 Tax=Niastella yeongjuensis TaxID=354355 RepID=A0A1V9F173_9BACT|nr:hypothetical protein [Niastella yeongjuensis]OQP51986.1 hypothetical protein A4H97_25555 [Niastella yeongjuensis]SEP36136.1 hypothetical protein SAMN05660816_05454 [Niastella yeongjuensis]
MKKPGILDKTDTTTPKRSLRWIILIPFIIVLGVLAAVVRGGESTDTINTIRSTKPGISAASDAKLKKMVHDNIMELVKVESNDYEYKNLGGISGLKITVINSTDFMLNRVRVKVTYIKANGSVWDTKMKDFYGIRPKSAETLKMPDSKRGTSIKYEIVTIKSKDLDL